MAKFGIRRRGPRRHQITLSELRTALGVTQSALARRLGTSQAAVLKMERAGDPRLSTVQRYVATLGDEHGGRARLDVLAVIDGDTEYLLALPREDDAKVSEFSPTAPERRAFGITAARIGHARGAWRLRAWDDPFLEQRFLDEGFIAISNDEIGDLTDWPDADVLQAKLRDAFPSRTRQAIGTFVRYWRDFRIDMQPGDVVVVPLTGRRAAIGEITGDYEYVPTEHEPKLRHRRHTRWLTVIRRDALDEDLRRVVNAPGTICRFGARDAAHRLRRTAETDT